MRLLTWNTAGRRKKQPEQLEAIAQLNVDVLCLQEVIMSTLEVFQRRLPEIGFPCLIHNAFSGRNAHQGARKYCLLTASRFPLEKMPHLYPVDWEEKFLRVKMKAGDSEIEIANAHIPPGSSHGWLKIDTLRSVYHNIRLSSAHHKILCGDFNTPQAEFRDGTIVTWGQRIKKSGEVRMRKGRGKLWDEGERLILEGLSAFDMVDGYRTLHGYEKEDFSFATRRGEKYFERRFDHVFCTRNLVVRGCHYVHKLRDARLSDHAGLIFEFGV